MRLIILLLGIIYVLVGACSDDPAPPSNKPAVKDNQGFGTPSTAKEKKTDNDDNTNYDIPSTSNGGGENNNAIVVVPVSHPANYTFEPGLPNPVAVSAITLVNNQLVIAGTNLDTVGTVFVSGQDWVFEIIAKTATEMTVGATAAISMLAGSTYNLIFKTAYASETVYTIEAQHPEGPIANAQIKAVGATGLKLTDANNLGIFIKDGGNVGIGVADPASLLSVAGTVSASDVSASGTVSGTTISASAGVSTVIISASGAATVDSLAVTNGATAATLSVSGDASAASLSVSGNVGIGTSTPSGALDVNADSIRVRTAKTPLSGDACDAGEIAWDANYIYICTASGVWKRAALVGGY